MSILHQLQLGYNKEQDRLLLTIVTKDFCEYRYWLTRPVIEPLWKLLLQLLNEDKKGQDQHVQESKKISEKIQKEKSQRNPVAEKFAHGINRRPYGDEPLLLAKIMAQPEENGICLLRLKDVQGHTLDCRGNSTIIIALCQLLQQTVAMANWNLHLEPLP